MELSYTVFDPTGNITVLVQTPVPVADQPRVAAALMAKETDSEQVCFRMPDTPGAGITVRMAGGEFCGNASMSAAAWLCAVRGLESAAVTVAIGGQLVPAGLFALGGYLAGDLYGDAHNGDDADDD